MSQPAFPPSGIQSAPKKPSFSLARLLPWVSLKLVLTLVCGLFVGGAGGFLACWFFLPRSEADAKTPGQRLGRLPSFGLLRVQGTPQAVAALGRLVPRGEVIDIGGLMGDRLAELPVKEGEKVDKGQVLGYLESHAERKKERDAIAARLTEAEQNLVADLAYFNALIKEAQVAVTQVETLDPLDVQAQDARVELLQSELTFAKTDLERMQSVTTPGAVSLQKRDQQIQLVRRCQEELKVGQAILAKFKAARDLNLAQAQAKLAAANAGLRRAETAGAVGALKENLAAAEARLNRTILKAPRDGTILKILTRPGERTEQKPILKMGDVSAMYAVAEVYETDVLLVKQGQRAEMASAALPHGITGTVERIGQLIFKNDVLHVDPAADADARVVEVWIKLDCAEPAARLINLQVDVAIDLSLPPSGGVSPAPDPCPEIP